MTLGALLLSLALPSTPPPSPALLPDLPPTAAVASITSPFALSVDLKLSPPSFGITALSVADPTGPRSYFGARYYSAPVGRFTTVDPSMTIQENVLDPQRWNRYAYGRNNPLRYVDPDGRDVFTQQEVFQTWDQYQSGGITLQQYQAHMDGIGRSGLLGIALFVPGPEDLVLGGLALRYGGFLGRIFGKSADDVLDVAISHRKSPRAAEHIDDAQAAGKPDVLTVDRGRTRPNRKESLKGTESQKGMDRDEYPPACCAEGGAGASVRPIPRGDNRSAGAQLGNQLRKVPDGTRVRVRTTDE